jgi:hypothetical protein
VRALANRFEAFEDLDRVRPVLLDARKVRTEAFLGRFQRGFLARLLNGFPDLEALPV